jgi:heme/copper-type cytochrome/quinol oxidase subunit 2
MTEVRSLMRFRIAVFLMLLALASSAFAVDRWIPIAGTVGNFRTDARILNPSGEKDIVVSAYFLPVNVSNNNERISGTPVTINVPKRSMRVLDDIVANPLLATGLGAILLTSPDEFVATSRIYAQVGASTLGQFSPAQGPGLAVTKGVVIQLKSNGAFRTNIGAVNIANATATVTWNLYDKTNAKIATVTKNMAAYEVTSPSNVVGFFPNIPSGADMNDAWVSFTSTNPIFAYGSVIDNVSTDPTFISMAQDTGSDPVVIVQPTVKEFGVTLSNFEIITDLNGLSALKVGDAVRMTVQASTGNHGFAMVGPDNQAVVPDALYSPDGPARTFNFTVSKTGQYTYFCTFASCGVGHVEMVGTFNVR